jgi:aspartate-semialdehyde dehydrogenase
MAAMSVAVIGATGAVGGEMLKVLKQRKFPLDEVRALATSRSAGQSIKYGDRKIVIEDVEKADLSGLRFALFAGGEIASSVHVPRAVAAGAVAIDNSSTFRMNRDVPLVVPEVNPGALKGHKGIIANPNCSTIQMVVALKPIYDAAGIERVVVSTYQSVSGGGREAMDELLSQSREVLDGREAVPKVLPRRIAFNLFPHIADFGENGYTGEETKMILETQKIMEDDSIRVTATTVRVPVLIGHSESVNIQTKRKITAAEARRILSGAPGISVVDDPAGRLYPTPIEAAGKDEVFVGRIREDLSHPLGLEMWVVSDNLRKGAALNAVQIAETMLRMGL